MARILTQPKNNIAMKKIITSLFCVIATQLLRLIADIYQYKFLITSNERENIVLTSGINDTIHLIALFSFILFYLISIITFVQWFRRAYFNLHIYIKTLTFSEGWAAGCWFVPIINLFRPFQIMNELYKETDYYLSKKHHNYTIKLKSRFLGWWWALFLISYAARQVATRFTLKADSLDKMTFSTIITIISTIISIALSLITIKVIKDYSSAETLLTEVKAENQLQP